MIENIINEVNKNNTSGKSQTSKHRNDIYRNW